MSRPVFRDAYLVEVDERPVGFVRRERNVWRVYEFAKPAQEHGRDGWSPAVGRD